MHELEEEVLEESEDEDQPKSKEETLRRRLLVVEDEKGKGEGEGHKWFTEVEKSKLLRKQTDVVCRSCEVNFLIHDSDSFCRRCGDIYILLWRWKVTLLLPVIAVLGYFIASACLPVFLQVIILGLKWLGCLLVALCA